MLVIYKGKLPALTTEYNGKRYSFSKINPIQEIPTIVYDFLKRSGHVHVDDVQPYDEGYKKEIIALNAEIDRLKGLLEEKPKEKPKKEPEKKPEKKAVTHGKKEK